MARLMNTVQKLLEAAFPGAAAQLEPFEPRPMIGGFVIWQGFEGVDAVQRTRLIKAAIEDKLDAAERKQVALLLPLTPLEMEVRQEALEHEEQAIRASVRKPVVR